MFQNLKFGRASGRRSKYAASASAKSYLRSHPTQVRTAEWENEMGIIMRQLIFYLQAITDDEGVTAIEYGLIAALVAVVCIAAWQLLGTSLSTTFSNLAASV
jgi:pilus assembly protein Flp/PilA